MRQKQSDRKKALSIVEAAERDMRFTLTLEPTESSSATIIRNIYECFRMLGEALLVSEGITSINHSDSIKKLINEVLEAKVKTKRPINLIDNFQRLRHNINYYGYKPNIEEAKDIISIAENDFQPVLKFIKKKINEI